jgi:hypothetical protein
MLKIASFLAGVYGIGIGPAVADSDGIKDGAKKTEQGFGELLKGIGQGVKKAGDAVKTPAKDKNESKRTDKKTDKGKEDQK